MLAAHFGLNSASNLSALSASPAFGVQLIAVGVSSHPCIGIDHGTNSNACVLHFAGSFAHAARYDRLHLYVNAYYCRRADKL